MNIFYLHHDTKKCAKYHCDKHVVKMILESAQLLCSAIIVLGGTAPYKLTHKNHPSSIWARAGRENWLWLYSLALELCKEYTFRYNKIHKTQNILLSLHPPENLPLVPFFPPTPAMPDLFKIENDVKLSYRFYYIIDKHHLLSWKKRNPPKWVNKLLSLF